MSYIFLFVITAVIFHNFVLFGQAGFNVDTFWCGLGRVLGYGFDVISIAVCAVLTWPALVVGVALSLTLISNPSAVMPNLIVFPMIAAVPLSWLALLGRLLLRLPSRAIGSPTPWSQIWQMGRGNTFRILLCVLVLALPVVLLQVNLFELFHGPLPSGWYLPITRPAGTTYIVLPPAQHLTFVFLRSVLNILGFVVFVAYFSNAFVALRASIAPASLR